ncbi:hypothetical protein EGH21_21715 [Halomicroarcula sp. F13]|uniref:KfrA N-terminal DNA-binding domain-containing protein n=1 Tax=Haloarcula rubra TaxID=2487747 RepID=A0AAW4PZJ5_9EURY|nr:hypothetical protein [Halomicroarcula rubra]MBX0325642.1 hypothetical protein [Halomicroarcula rubra]
MGDTDHHRKAERILLALDQQDGPVLTSDVVSAAGLNKTQQVHYRCTGGYHNALVDAGQVQKIAPEPGGEAKWLITELGERWVKANYDDIKIPQTEEEAINVCQRALSTAKAAKSTAATVQGKFTPLKSEVHEALETIKEVQAETEEMVESTEDRAQDAAEEAALTAVQDLEEQIKSVKESKEEDLQDVKRTQRDLETDVGKLQEYVDEVKVRVLKDFATEMRVDVEVNSGKISNLNDRVDELEEEISRHDRQISRLENKVDKLDSTIEDLKRRLDNVEDTQEELAEAQDASLFGL